MLFSWSPHLPLHSRYLHAASMSAPPITLFFFPLFILVQISLATPVIRHGWISSCQWQFHSFPCILFDHLISLPCGNLIFYLRMGHIEARFTILLSIPSGSCLPKNISTHAHPVSRTIVRIEYVVMSFLSAPFSHNRLSLLPSMVACVYIQGIRFLRGFGFDWNHCYL